MSRRDGCRRCIMQGCRGDGTRDPRDDPTRLPQGTVLEHTPKGGKQRERERPLGDEIKYSHHSFIFK